MLEITEYSIASTHITKLTGRLDGVNSEEINKYIITLLDKGIRSVILDFSDVNYISSAGLRVLLINQKKISSAGGEIAIYKVTPNIKEVFKLSGFLRIFREIENDNEFQTVENNVESQTKSSVEFENLSLEILKVGDSSGKIEPIGNSGKIETSSYDKTDVINLPAKEIENAFGFAAIGDDWDSIKDYFGESFVLNNNLFVYPAVKRPAVDFMIYSPAMTDTVYSFLNGFKLSGSPSVILSFRMKKTFVEVQDLLDSISKALNLKAFGFTIIAESKGLRGMNLKKVPITENKPLNGKNIFDNGNFSDWVNFPVDCDDFNSVIAGVGFYADSDKKQLPVYSTILPSESRFHLHSGIFEKTLLNFKSETFDNDLSQILNELEAKKVQHILGGSVLSMGTLAIIGMEN